MNVSLYSKGRRKGRKEGRGRERRKGGTAGGKKRIGKIRRAFQSSENS